MGNLALMKITCILALDSCDTCYGYITTLLRYHDMLARPSIEFNVDF